MTGHDLRNFFGVFDDDDEDEDIKKRISYKKESRF